MIFSESFSVTLPVCGKEYVISVLRVYVCDVYMLWKPKGEQSHKTSEAHNLITHVYIAYTHKHMLVCAWVCVACLSYSGVFFYFFLSFLLDSNVSTKAQVIAVK